MPIHKKKPNKTKQTKKKKKKKTRICCWHEIHFDIQIYIQSHRHPHAQT